MQLRTLLRTLSVLFAFLASATIRWSFIPLDFSNCLCQLSSFSPWRKLLHFHYQIESWCTSNARTISWEKQLMSVSPEELQSPQPQLLLTLSLNRVIQTLIKPIRSKKRWPRTFSRSLQPWMQLLSRKRREDAVSTASAWCTAKKCLRKRNCTIWGLKN